MDRPIRVLIEGPGYYDLPRVGGVPSLLLTSQSGSGLSFSVEAKSSDQSGSWVPWPAYAVDGSLGTTAFSVSDGAGHLVPAGPWLRLKVSAGSGMVWLCGSEIQLPFERSTSPALNLFCLVGDGGTSTVVGEVLDENGKTVDVNVSLAVTITAKSWESWYEASSGTPTYAATMRGFRIHSVSGSALLVNTAGNGDPSTNNGVTSGLEPASGQAFSLAVGDYTQDNIGIGLGF